MYVKYHPQWRQCSSSLGMWFAMILSFFFKVCMNYIRSDYCCLIEVLVPAKSWCMQLESLGLIRFWIFSPKRCQTMLLHHIMHLYSLFWLTKQLSTNVVCDVMPLLASFGVKLTLKLHETYVPYSLLRLFKCFWCKTNN